MKKLKDKTYQVSTSKKRSEHNLRRKDIPYSPYSSEENSSTNTYQNQHKQNAGRGTKMIPPPKFSFIHNTDESIAFFDRLNEHVNKGIKKIFIDMRKLQDLSVDVLLYIVSMDKIFKEEDKNISLTIRIPRDPLLAYKVYTSGIQDYFSANGKEFPIPKEGFFPIRDGRRNEADEEKDDGKICGDAVDFAKQFFDGHDEKKKKHFIMLYEALAELMQNTDDHAYDTDSIIDNWYLYANKTDNGVAFYFFDNGQGIIKTARKSIIETLSQTIGLEQTNILLSVLNGEFRSQTKLSYRGKGLPQVNDYLQNDDIIGFMVLTNKVGYYKTSSDATFKKLNNNFKGTFFLWSMT